MRYVPWAGALILCLSAAGCASHPQSAQALPPAKVLAQDAERRGDWSAAARHWEAAAAAAPNDKATALATVHALRLSNACGEATYYLQRLRASSPHDLDVLMETGKCHLVSGRYSAAKSAFEEAATINPKSWEVETDLATTYDFMELPQDATRHHHRALKLAPSNPIVLSNAGLSAALAGDLTGALALMQRAAAQPDAPPRVRLNLAFLEALAGHGDVAGMMARQESASDDGTVRLLQRIAAAHK